MSLSKIAALLPKAVISKTGGLTASLPTQTFLGSTMNVRSIVTSTLVQAGDRQVGQVKWFDPVKGYGFIIPGDGSSDLFVHQTSIVSNGFRSLADGEEVEFEIGDDPNGRARALNVTGPGGDPVKGSPRPNQMYPPSGGRSGDQGDFGSY